MAQGGANEVKTPGPASTAGLEPAGSGVTRRVRVRDIKTFRPVLRRLGVSWADVADFLVQRAREREGCRYAAGYLAVTLEHAWVNATDDDLEEALERAFERIEETWDVEGALKECLPEGSEAFVFSEHGMMIIFVIAKGWGGC